ncbi:hypothetical protein COOONC_11880 [Cooperia oncophora]
MSWVPLTSIMTSITTGTLGIAANSLLIYLVLTNTPQELVNYSVLILNIAIIDLLACIAALFVHYRFVSDGVTRYHQYRGPCLSYGSHTCSAA